MKMKKNKGITLIVLIITIVVMLILVAVSIDLIVNDKLFNSAGDAVSKTNEKVEEQQKRVDELMGRLDNVEKTQIKHNFKYTDNTLGALKCECTICGGKTYNVGQEIAYTGGPAGTKWAVLGTEDSDKNGTNETLLLTNYNLSAEELTLEGADAYINGIAKIEAKCKEIYGSEARAMTIDDVNNTLGYTPTGGMYLDRTTWRVLEDFSTTVKDYMVNVYGMTEADFDADVTAGTIEGPEEGKNVGDYKIDGYMYNVAEGLESDVPGVATNISNAARNLIFGDSLETRSVYWLASRGCSAYSYVINFGPGLVSYGYAKNFYFGDFCSSYRSDGRTRSDTLPVRAIIPLRYEIPATGSVLVSGTDWWST